MVREPSTTEFLTVKEVMSIDEQKRLMVDYNEVNAVILEMYESKVVKIVRKLPRSHLILLGELCTYY